MHDPGKWQVFGYMNSAVQTLTFDVIYKFTVPNGHPVTTEGL